MRKIRNFIFQVWVRFLDILPQHHYKILVWRIGATEPIIFVKSYDNSVLKEFVFNEVKTKMLSDNWIINDPLIYEDGYRVFDIIELENN